MWLGWPGSIRFMNQSPASLHFIGACGTAMGAVAAAMSARGYRVTGSDAKCYPPMSDFLRERGLTLCEGYRPENIPDDVDLVVVGNAISRGNEEVECVLDRKLRYISLPEVLKEFFLRGRRNFVVTGTHGKTTTSSMLAWIFQHAGLNPGYLIGGLPKNLGCGAVFTDSGINVLEGDEYDTAFFDKRSKFLHYLPELVIVNNIEFDHADIYSNLEEIKTSFRRLMRIVPRNGLVLLNGDDPVCREIAADVIGLHRLVGFGENCTSRIENPEYPSGSGRFTLDGTVFTVPMDGEFNLRNATMAVCAARFAGVDDAAIAAALAGFEGVSRRQELRGEKNGVRVIDDFAHHPTAIRLAIRSMRQRYPDSRVWAIFEPRSNTTRRNIFQHDLADALGEADRVVVAAVEDPGKVAPADRLDPDLLARTLIERGRPAWHISGTETIVRHIAEGVAPGDVLLILTNGGFDGIHAKLLAAL